jgi:cysteine desulfuration protein SufE
MIREKQEKVVQEFSQLKDWEDRYKRIIELGKQMPDMPAELKSEKNQVRGCQSQVWMHAELNSQKQMVIVGDSDALLVKGLVALLLSIYSGATPQEVLNTPPDFLKSLGFEEICLPVGRMVYIPC